MCCNSQLQANMAPWRTNNASGGGNGLTFFFFCPPLWSHCSSHRLRARNFVSHLPFPGTWFPPLRCTFLLCPFLRNAPGNFSQDTPHIRPSGSFFCVCCLSHLGCCRALRNLLGIVRDDFFVSSWPRFIALYCYSLLFATIPGANIEIMWCLVFNRSIKF